MQFFWASPPSTSLLCAFINAPITSTISLGSLAPLVSMAVRTQPRVVSSSARLGRNSRTTASSSRSVSALSSRPACSKASMLSLRCFSIRRKTPTQPLVLERLGAILFHLIQEGRTDVAQGRHAGRLLGLHRGLHACRPRFRRRDPCFLRMCAGGMKLAWTLQAAQVRCTNSPKSLSGIGRLRLRRSDQVDPDVIAQDFPFARVAQTVRPE